ncbi:uncharacterized protein LOC132270669 [Cornus florida]|uniref:uncharacterized protein LOC132270669 n=1 Tax=Cornus florida TaxID=4283 RepID=UPI00289DD11B|nr:uncharacterized protein LOC132270669 [Cornus florida]
MANNYLVEVSPNPSPSTPLPSIPLHLSGFLSGDTIQVQGDTENLQFSVQFSINHKHNSENQFHCPGTDTPQNLTRLNSGSSSYMTPITTHEEEDQNAHRDSSYHATDSIPTVEECRATKKGTIVTRLRSGVLSPVTYCPRKSSVEDGNLQLWRKISSRKKGKGKGNDVLDRVLRRHSLPVRPCSSYAFFVITTWGAAKSSSFGGTSKKLGEMWCKLPPEEKKVFEDMALQDNVRYRRQCMLLRSKDGDGEVLDWKKVKNVE